MLTFCFLLSSLDLAVQSWGDALSTSGSAHVQGEIQNKKLKLSTVRKGKSQINQVRRLRRYVSLELSNNPLRNNIYISSVIEG